MTRRLHDLMVLIGGPDEIAPIDNFKFSKIAGEIIARSGANIRSRMASRQEYQTAKIETGQRWACAGRKWCEGELTANKVFRRRNSTAGGKSMTRKIVVTFEGRE